MYNDVCVVELSLTHNLYRPHTTLLPACTTPQGKVQGLEFTIQDSATAQAAVKTFVIESSPSQWLPVGMCECVCIYI